MKLTLLLLGAFVLAASAKDVYDGFKVFRLNPSTEEQKKFLAELEERDNTLDFWNGVNNHGTPVDVMVKPEEQAKFLRVMTQYGIPSEEMINDVQKLIDVENVELKAARAGMTWTAYYTLDEIYAWLDELAAANPGVVTIVNAGKSYQGRDLKGVKVSFGTGKRGVLIEGGIHAREWISPATVTYILNELLTSTDPAFQKISKSFDWYLFPSNNPDGYVFTHTTTRLWRKTRTPYGTCFGADPNRNWNVHWGEAGTSTSACSETYGGPRAFSEVETLNMSNYIRTIGASLDVFLGFHSYSQLLLIPYGHTTAPLDNYAEVKQIGQAAAASLERVYGTKYVVGNIAEAIYPASGTSGDWVKQEFKTPISLTYELRDTGAYGFVLPANQIIPNCIEVMASIVTIFEEGEKFGYFTLG